MYDIKKLEIKIHKLVDSNFVWNYKTAFKWKWLEFLDYSTYEYWTDAKNIDFLKSQTEQKLLEKRFREERELRVVFVLDLRESMYFNIWENNKINSLIETFYILAYSANLNNDRIEVVLFDEKTYEIVKLTKQKSSILMLISKINNFSKNTKKLKLTKNIFEYILALNIKKSLIFYLTDEIKTANYLKVLAHYNDFVYINIFDYFENKLSTKWVFNLWFWLKNLFLNTRSSKVEKYIAYREQKISDFRKTLKKINIDYLHIDDKTNIFLLLLNFFYNR